MNTRISTLAIICTLGISMSAFAAPSVRTLGGASTYSSAASAASGSAPTASAPTRVNTSSKASDTGENLRGGAMRVNSGSTIGNVRASSSRAASAPRLSIGKYLTTGQSVSGGSSGDIGVRPPQQSDEVSGADLEEIRKDITNIYNAIENIQNEFNSYVDKEYTFSYDQNTGILTVKDGDETVLEASMVTFAQVQAIENALNQLIEKHDAEVLQIYSEIAQKQDILTPENLKGAGNVEIGFNNGVITVTGTGAADAQEKLVPGTAISINDDTNVISVNVGEGLYVDTATNTLNASVSEGALYTGGTGITVDNSVHQIVLALKAGNGIKVNGDTVSLDTPSASGNYFYSVSGGGAGVWTPFAVVDASALPSVTTVDETVVE